MDMDQFIPEEALDMLSYRSALGRSLKQISLRLSYCSFGAAKTTLSISGVTSMYTNTGHRRFIRSMRRIPILRI